MWIKVSEVKRSLLFKWICICIWGVRGGKDTAVSEIHRILLNKQQCVAIAKPSQLIKDLHMLHLKCGMLQGKDMDLQAQVEIGARA